MFTLYDYQERALKELGTNGEQVLSICPGGGKTFTAIEYIKRHTQFKKVLILTHGTNVLKEQWINEFNKLGLDFSTSLGDANRITISLPHSFINKVVPKYDLVIVDEAHEFYFAEMVQNIIQKSNPTCVLLLTGTPSKFIKNNMKPVIVSGVEVFKSGNLTDTYFGVVKSTYKIKLDEFTIEGEATSTLTSKQTKESLEALVKEMLIRLKTANYIKESPNVLNKLKNLNLNKFQEAFGQLNKTMIAARDTNQAKALYNCLIKNNVKVVISDHKSDENSTEIEAFKTNPDIQVLIVVRRGILGFNMLDLVNVVDFTMSRNIDRIYQLYARVLRKHEKYEKKFFFRMCSAINPEIDSIHLQAAMCLNNYDFISKYNGKNLNNMEILVPKKKTSSKVSTTSKTKERPESKNKIIKMDESMLNEILNLELLSELTTNSKSKYWKEIGYMKYGEVISKLTGKTFSRPIVNITEENLLWMIKHGRVDERIYE